MGSIGLNMDIEFHILKLIITRMVATHQLELSLDQQSTTIVAGNG